MKNSPKPRRRKKTAAARLRPFWLLLMLLLVVCALGAYAFATWDGFKPHTIRVRGNRVVTKDAILNAAAIRLDTNIWLQNTKGIAERVDAIPYIATARVHRIPPGTILIDVTERKPFAVLEVHGGRWIVDRDLRVLQSDDGGFRELPQIDASGASVHPGETLDDAGISALRDDDEALTAAGIAAAIIARDKYGDVVVTLRDGVRVLLGDETDLAKKIKLIEPILTQVARAGRPIAAIDLRAPNTPVVVYKK